MSDWKRAIPSAKLQEVVTTMRSLFPHVSVTEDEIEEIIQASTSVDDALEGIQAKYALNNTSQLNDVLSTFIF